MRSPIPAARSSIITRKRARPGCSGMTTTYPAAVWLNPVPEQYWGYTSSIQVVRDADAGPDVPADAGRAGRGDADAEPEIVSGRRFRPVLSLLAALALAGGAHAQTTPEARAAWGFDRSDLAPDPRIRFGVLANGMRYAILPNRTPARAVAIRLLVRVGAAYGAPGEAHYLEHMAFMGSRHMPGGRSRPAEPARASAARARTSTPIPATPTLITGSILPGPDRRRSSESCCCCATLRRAQPRARGGRAGAGRDRGGGAAALRAGGPARAGPDRLLRARHADRPRHADRQRERGGGGRRRGAAPALRRFITRRSGRP